MIIDDISTPFPDSQRDQEAAARYTGFSRDQTPPSSGVELRVKALNCPNCGAQILDNQPACVNCGSGLVYEFHFTGDRFNFSLPKGAREIPLSAFPNLDLGQIANKLFALVQKVPETVCVYWRGVPMIVSPNITPDQAEKNWSLLSQQVERTRLGAVWIEALQHYQSLVEKINRLNLEQRRRLVQLGSGEKRKSWLSASEFRNFVERPNFPAIEKLMPSTLGDNDAEELVNVVTDINRLLDQIEL